MKRVMSMKKLARLLAAAALVSGAYIVTFGLPAPLSQLLPGDAGTAEQSSNPAARGGGPGGPGRPGGGATMVVVEPLQQKPYVDILRAIGSTVAQSSINVVTSVSGTVTDVSIVPNSEVAAGDILLQLDNRTGAFLGS